LIDASGRFVTPGLVEGHLHQYHSYLGVTEYVEALLSHGVTATADAFYGPGIVAGVPQCASSRKRSSGCDGVCIFLVPALAGFKIVTRLDANSWNPVLRSHGDSPTGTAVMASRSRLPARGRHYRNFLIC